MAFCCLAYISEPRLYPAGLVPQKCSVIYALAAGLGTLNTQGIAFEKGYNTHYGIREARRSYG